MSISLLVAVAVSQISSSPTIAQMKVPYDQANGYFDYVLAGEELEQGQFLVYEIALRQDGLKQAVEYSKSPPSGSEPEKERGFRLPKEQLAVAEPLLGLRPYEVRKLASQRFRNVIIRLEAARRKQSKDPRTGAPITPDTAFPELAMFKTATRFSMMMADLNYVDGRPLAANENILDGFRMSRAVQTSPVLINALVGRALIAISLSKIEKWLGQMSLPEADLIRRFTEERLALPTQFLTSARAEQASSLQAVDWIMDGKMKQTPAWERLQTLAPEERQQIARAAKAVVERQYTTTINLLGKSEFEWAAYLNEVQKGQSDEGQDPSELSAEDLVVGTVSAPPETIVQVALMERVQMRLLRAAMAIVEYRGMNDALPERLDQVGTGDLITDPVLRTPMKYRRNGTEFELASMGSNELGEIRLRYRRPPSSDGPPPP